MIHQTEMISRVFCSCRCETCNLPDAAHIEVGNLHNLGEAINTRCMRGVQLLLSNGTQGPHKLHNGFTVQLVTAPPPQHVGCQVYIYLQLNKDPQLHRTGALRQYEEDMYLTMLLLLLLAARPALVCKAWVGYWAATCHGACVQGNGGGAGKVSTS